VTLAMSSHVHPDGAFVRVYRGPGPARLDRIDAWLLVRKASPRDGFLRLARDAVGTDIVPTWEEDIPIQRARADALAAQADAAEARADALAAQADALAAEADAAEARADALAAEADTLAAKVDEAPRAREDDAEARKAAGSE
jgi:hypothetical protein